jgi:transcriptional regulator of arginine metabolism
VSVDWNESIVVVRTFSGHSDSVALAIDNMGMEDVLGTISGRDNVVFVALRKGSRGDDFIAALKGKIPEFDPE